MSMVLVPFAELKSGDVVSFTGNGRGRGGHYNVTVVVDKINKATFNATEAERSYAPGTKWRVHASIRLYKRVL